MRVPYAAPTDPGNPGHGRPESGSWARRTGDQGPGAQHVGAFPLFPGMGDPAGGATEGEEGGVRTRAPGAQAGDPGLEDRLAAEQAASGRLIRPASRYLGPLPPAAQARMDPMLR